MTNNTLADGITDDDLVQLDLGDEIPENIYIAIAQIIAFAYQLQGKEPETYKT